MDCRVLGECDLRGEVRGAAEPVDAQPPAPGGGRDLAEHVERVSPGPVEIDRGGNGAVCGPGQRDVVPGASQAQDSRSSGSPRWGSTWSTPRPNITSPQRKSVSGRPAGTDGRPAVSSTGVPTACPYSARCRRSWVSTVPRNSWARSRAELVARLIPTKREHRRGLP